jgi:hypothetical protein
MRCSPGVADIVVISGKCHCDRCCFAGGFGHKRSEPQRGEFSAAPEIVLQIIEPIWDIDDITFTEAL